MRSEFEKAFPVPAHWIEFDGKSNKYYCPFVADATASEYQSKWVVWQHQQTKVDELQSMFVEQTRTASNQQEKIDELQEEFAEDERFLKEKIEQKEQQIVELKYLQSMDKDFIHALKNRCDELQKRVSGLTQVMEKLLEEMKYPTATFEEVICCGVKELEQALKGGEA